METIPKPGEFYRHFKNNLYQVLAVAEHTETGELMVVYQALYGNFRIYVRPLSSFCSEVDREKYPAASQKMRFQKVELEGEAPEGRETAFKEEAGEESGSGPHPLLMQFLDAEDTDGQIGVLTRMKGKITQQELDSIYLSLDMAPVTGDVNQQLLGIIRTLETRKKFDGSRLR